MNNQIFDPNSNIQNRELRVFVSSPFKDMKNEERKYLVDTVFPAIKEICRDHGVYFLPYDLRWGITEEQKKNGQVVDVCLSAIKRCKPFFIGLLGERYGSKPNPDDLINNPSLKKFQFLEEDFKNELSLTEIEMQYGVLREPKPMCAVFGIRSKDFCSKTPNPDALNDNSPLDDEKLEKLKDAVRKYAQQRQDWLEYDSVEDMGEIVKSFFSDVIEELFHEKPSRYERLMVQQDSFKRQKTLLYMPRKGDYQKINAFVNDSEQILTITGEPGNGKSALVANWMETRKDDLEFIYCFVGASKQSDNPVDILKLLIAQLNQSARKELFGDDQSKLERDLEKKPQSQNERPKSELDILSERFQNAVTKRQKEIPNKKLVLIFDGINQLDYSNYKKLSWIPQLPKDVKAIFTTRKGDDTMESLRERDCAVLEVDPLTLEQIKGIISGYLKNQSRQLTDEQVNRIAEDKESESPVVLRTLLDELCYLGEYTELDNQINSYIQTNGKDEFFGKVLERLENSYDQSKVSKLLTALSAARAGLSSEELLGVANYREGVSASSTDADSDTEDCTLFNWNQIVFSLDSHFIVRAGRNYFSHDIIKEAADKRYKNDINKFRRQIVGYMINNDKIGPRRKCEEVPWQLYQLKDWKELSEFLLDYKNFYFMCESFKSDLEHYWQELRNNDNSPDEYLNNDLDASLKKYFKDENIPVLDQVYFYNNLADFGMTINKLQVSERGLTEARDVLRNNRDSFEDKERYESCLATTLYNLGTIHHLPQKKQAEKEYSEALDIFRDLYSKKQDEYRLNVAMAYNDLGLLHLEMRIFDKSKDELSNALDIYENYIKNHPKELETRYFYTMPLLNRGLLYMENAYFLEAKEDFLDGLEILLELDKEIPGACDDDIARTQLNLGFLLYNMYCNSQKEEYIAESEDFLKKSLDAFSQLEQKFPDAFTRELGMTHLNLGNTYMQMGRTDKAKNEFSDALRLFQEQNKEYPQSCDVEIAKTLINLGSLSLNLYRDSHSEKDLTEADVYLTKALETFRYLDRETPDAYKPQFVKVLSDISVVHLSKKQEDLAKAELNEALDVCRSLNESEDSQVYAGSFFYQLAIIHKDHFHDYSLSKELLQDSLAAFKKLNELHPGEFENEIREVKSALYELGEENNCFFKLGFKLGRLFASIVTCLIGFVKNIFRGFSSHE